jgi:aminoglycoside phosphotransferase (APT) family kinase protein
MTSSPLPAVLAELGLISASGPVDVRRIGEGHSNVTLLVDDGARRVVVRRAPDGGGYDVLREARVIDAIGGRGVPVPRVLAMVEAGAWEAPFFVMEHVPGVVVTTATPAPLDTPASRRRISEEMVDTLARLHGIDWVATGLPGRPEGFNARHLARIAALIADDEGGVPEDFRETLGWLRADVPAESGAAVLHNDFRLGNLMLGAEPPERIAAVLDWELSAVGDPLLDLAYLVVSTPDPARPRTPLHDLGRALDEDGYLGRDEIVARYRDRTGAGTVDLAWHLVFADWKLAVLFELGHRRYLAGDRDEQYRDRSTVRAFLAAAAAGIRAP